MRSAPWVEPALDKADLVLPMPLSRQRLQERGFNQTLLLARALDSQKVRHDLLLRIKDTPAQSSLPRNERLLSVANAYALEPLHAPLIRDKHIVLIDDVMTTGATLNAAARVLRQAGAAHITAVVFARTE
jgi:ComF family protein